MGVWRSLSQRLSRGQVHPFAPVYAIGPISESVGHEGGGRGADEVHGGAGSVPGVKVAYKVRSWFVTGDFVALPPG